MPSALILGLRANSNCGARFQSKSETVSEISPMNKLCPNIAASWMPTTNAFPQVLKKPRFPELRIDDNEKETPPGTTSVFRPQLLNPIFNLEGRLLMMSCTCEFCAPQPWRNPTETERNRGAFQYRWRRPVISLLLAATLLLAVQRPTAAQPASQQPPTSPPIPRNVSQAIRRGLDYLKREQNERGAFGNKGYRSGVAVTGLCGLAFMAHGSTPGRGPFGPEVNRCLTFILRNAREDGFVTSQGIQDHRRMYGHGFATLFLAQAYGMTADSRVRTALISATRLIVESQNPKGGWRYEPSSRDADLSVTICQVMALRAARNAGIHVPKDTIDRCTQYVRECHNPDGGYNYQITERGGSAFSRSAAGVVALYNAGIYEGPEIEKSLDYLELFHPDRKNADAVQYFYYGHYYAVQAMWHAGKQRWDRWYPALCRTLTTRQQPNGCWPDQICNEYGTAMACIILQMPTNFLPILQR